MSEYWKSYAPKERAAFASHPEAPLDWVLALLEDPYRKVRSAAAENIKFISDPALLSTLAQHRFSQARRAASQNPSTPKEVLQLLQKAGATPDLSSFTEPQSLTLEEFETLYKGGVFARCLVARHLETPEAIRRALCQDPSPAVRCSLGAFWPLQESIASQPYQVRRSAAKDPASSAALLTALAKDPHPNVRAEIAKNISSPSSLFEPMLRGERGFRGVQRAAAKNPNLPKEWLLSLLRRFPLEVMQNPVFPLLQLEEPDLLSGLSHNTLLKLAQQEPIAEWLAAWIFGRDMPAPSRALAQNKTTPPELLSRLSASTDEEIRALCVENPSTPKETLTLLYKAGASLSLQEVSKEAPELSKQELAKLLALGGFGKALALRNPNISDEKRLLAIEEDTNFYGSFLLQYFAPVSEEILKKVLEQPKGCNDDATMLAARHPSLQLANVIRWEPSLGGLRSLAMRPSLPEFVIEHLLSFDEENVSLYLLNYQSLTETQQKKLALSKHTNVRKQLAKHPNRPLAFLQKLWEAGAYYDLEDCVDNPEVCDPIFLKEITGLGAFGVTIAAKNSGTPVALLESFFREGQEHLSLATNAALPLPMLEQLKNIQSEETRKALLQNPALPSAWLDEIHQSNKSLAVTTLIAEHPNTSAELLLALSKSTNPQIQKAIAANPNTPSALLQRGIHYDDKSQLAIIVKRYPLDRIILWRLSTCAFPEIREAAGLHPMFPQEKRALLMRLGLTEYLRNYGEPDITLKTSYLRLLSRQSAFVKTLVLLHPNITEEIVGENYSSKDSLRQFRDQLAGSTLKERLTKYPPAAWLREVLRDYLAIYG